MSAEETVRVIVLALAAIVILILLITVRYWRWTKPVHPALEKLDDMKAKRRR